jgi:integrase
MVGIYTHMVFDIRKVKCKVGIEDSQGKLRLRLPREAVGDKSKRYISTGLDSTPENYKRVQQVAYTIEEKLLSGELTSEVLQSLTNFKPKLLVLPTPPKLTTVQLWEMYSEHKRSQVAPTTFIKEYQKKFFNHIKKLPSNALENGAATRDFLLKTTTADTTKRVLLHLNAACEWAVETKLLTTNSFEGMAKDIKLNKHYQENINPFTLEEREAILKAFEQHPHHKHYYNFVRFLFLTGCRLGEAIALQWRHINKDCSVVTFAESYDSQLGIRKDTKTHKVRRFPCNATLRDLLQSIKPYSAAPDHLVFSSPKGLPIDSNNFTHQVWKGYSRKDRKQYKGLVTQLVEQGLVESYRPPYNTRHTFITMCIEAGMTAPQVAKLVGNSPEVILKHYCGSTLKFDVPVV